MRRKDGNIFLVAGLAILYWSTAPAAAAPPQKKPSFRVSSPAFAKRAVIPASYTCKGIDRSPELVWQGMPEKTASLAVIVDDPDAPGGSWVHWVYYDLPPALSKLPAGVEPRETPASGGKQGRNDFGKLGYNGPCPPPGPAHRYFFRLLALDLRLELAAGKSKQEFLAAAAGHILDQAEWVGTFARSD